MMSGDIAVLAPEPEGSIDWGSSQIEDYNPTIAGFPAVSDMLDGRAVPCRVLEVEALLGLERAPAVIVSPWRYRVSGDACAALRRFVEGGGLLIGFGEQGSLLDGRPVAGMALGDLFGVQPVPAPPGPRIARVEFLQSPISGGLPIGEEGSATAPVGVTLVPGQQGEFPGRARRAGRGSVPAACWRLDGAEDDEDAVVGDFCVYRRVGRGATVWFDDALGVSLFLRCRRELAEMPPVDDLEPVVWRLICNALEAHGLPLVFALPTPERRSFSLSHDVCANPWEEAALPGRVSSLAEFERRRGLTSTWYLRTVSAGGHMPHPRLRPSAVPAAILIKVIDGWEPHASQSSIGYHGEQFGWILRSRFGDLSVAECYRQSRRELERWASPVIAGSTHFGNFGEDYERDFEGAAEAGFRLWRNSYKRCGLTPMRPYRLPNGRGGQIAGLLGYLDAICEDIAAEDMAAPPLSAAAEKALAWLEISGGGHLFLHAHAVQFAGLGPRRGLRSWLRSSAVMLARRRVSSGRARYQRACDLVRDAGLRCLTHDQVVHYRQQLDLLRLDTEAVGDQSAAQAPRRFVVRARAPFTGLTLATLGSCPVAVVDDEGRQLPVAAERGGDWNYVTVIGMPAVRARASRLPVAVAAGLA